MPTQPRPLAALLLAATFALPACGSSGRSADDGDGNGPVDIRTLAGPVAEPTQVLRVPQCFTVVLRADMKEIPSQPIDSIAGLWSSGDLRLEYDCGAYDTSYGESPPVSETPILVDGNEGTLLRFDHTTERDGTTYRHLLAVDLATELGSDSSTRHLNVAVFFSDPEREDAALAILASLRDVFRP